ncbi:MAG: nucleotide exchange factor GrpE [Patescibacteria group bacterium]
MSDEQNIPPVIPTGASEANEAEESLRGDAVAEKKSFFHKTCKNCEKVNPVKSPLGGVSEAEFNRVKAEAEEYKIGWQRALADYQNLQKETLARRAEWAQMSEQQILEEFIPVYEHLKMSTSGVAGENNPWLDGVNHVLKQFADIMKAHGVEEIKTVGEKFDPKYHEAVGHETIEGAGEDEIVKEISGGFKMGDRVIKAARVMLAK